MRIVTGNNPTGIVLAAADGLVLIGGTVTNDGDFKKAVYGGATVNADIQNLGTVGDTTGTYIGIYLKATSTIINGSETNTNATIAGDRYAMLLTATSAVTNYGSIKSTGTTVFLESGGTVTNGSIKDTAALISSDGVFSVRTEQNTTVTNFGAITSATGTGVSLDAGGTVNNGSSASTLAQITGVDNGIVFSVGTGTVNNYGTITATSSANGYGAGVGGKVSVTQVHVVNGSATSTKAAISGSDGVEIIGAGDVANFGTITGTGPGGEAVFLGSGTITNGSASAAAGVLHGDFVGAYMAGMGHVTNFGTIEGGGVGALFLAGGTAVNGSASNHTATIGNALEGIAVSGATAVTVTNYGVISGQIYAALFGGGADKLIVEPGSQLIGAVDGGAGLDTLAFAGAVNMSLANFAHFETVTLANATNGLVLTDAMVASSDNGHILTIVGGSGNDAVNATAVTTAADRVYITAGAGNDTLVGGAGLDLFTFNAADLTSSDLVSGGGGTQIDTLLFTSAGTIAASAFTNVSHIEQILLANGTNSLTLTDALATSADDGHILHVSGGTGADTINAAAITTATNRVVFIGGGGADVLTAGAGADIFSYLAASDSTSTGYDTITGANFAADRIDVPGGAGTITMVETARSGALDSGANFDTELANAFSTLAAHHAGLLTASSGTLSGQTFLVVDLNGTTGYQSGADLVIHLVSPTGTLAAGDFI